MLRVNSIRKRMKKAITYVAGLSLGGTIAISAFGADEGREIYLEPIVVTVSRIEEPISQIASSASIITENEIKEKKAKTVLELLREVPGLDVVQSGGPGGITYVYLRGANPEHTLVMIDGIEVNDPMEITRQFDFAHLTTDNIERIEVIRGPQSTLYGSDAIGGVINIITKRGADRPKLHLLAEGGSYKTFRESMELSGKREKMNYSLSVSKFDSGGFSRAADGNEDDSYENTTLSSRLGLDVFEDSQLNFIVRYTYAESGLDDTAYNDDPNYMSWRKYLATKFEFNQAINSLWDHKLSFTYSDARRKYRDGKDNIDTAEDVQSWYKGDNKKVEWQHNFSINDINTLTLGFDGEEERGSSLYRSGALITKIDRRSVDNKGYYLQNQLKLWEKVFATFGIRVDDHEKFSSDTNYKISLAYLIKETGTKLKANWGTGFKAPSIFMLYNATYGDPNMQPEESKSYDLGFEQKFFDNPLNFEAIYFHNRFDQLIDFDWVTLKYENIGKARTEGVETKLSLEPREDLEIKAVYTYLDSEDKITGNKLRRRPRNKFNLGVGYRVMKKVKLNLDLNYFGSRWDDATNTNKVKKYTRVDLLASYDVTEDIQIFTRVENLFDRRYQEVRGFNSPEFSCYGGFKATF